MEKHVVETQYSTSARWNVGRKTDLEWSKSSPDW